MRTLGSNSGNSMGIDSEELYLDATRKRNKLLDLEIETKEVELEIKKVELKHLGGVIKSQDPKKTL